jgi:hypothetical protein
MGLKTDKFRRRRGDHGKCPVLKKTVWEKLFFLCSDTIAMYTEDLCGLRGCGDLSPPASKDSSQTSLIQFSSDTVHSETASNPASVGLSPLDCPSPTSNTNHKFQVFYLCFSLTSCKSGLIDETGKQHYFNKHSKGQTQTLE